VVSNNKSLMAELARSAARDQRASTTPLRDRGDHPVYRSWHAHIGGLIAAHRPGADADMLAHLLPGAIQCDPVLAGLSAETGRLAAAMRTLACGVLDAPGD
jgi:hypothetical protein